MDWLKVRIEAHRDESGLVPELIAAQLIELGITNFQTEDGYEFRTFLENNEEYWDYADDEIMAQAPGNAEFTFYLPVGGEGLGLLHDISDAVNSLKEGEYGELFGTVRIVSENVSDDGWLHDWRKHYKPFKIGETIVVKPYWEEYHGEGVVFNINPGSVFGTGLHQTTQMCVEGLEPIVKNGDKVLDLGCGSGILAIIATLLADGVNAVAVDIDKAAEMAVFENAGLNGVPHESLSVYTGDIMKDQDLYEIIARNRYDVITANIIADIVAELTPCVSGLIKPGGIFISSGIISDQTDSITAALKENNFDIIEIKKKDEWVCVVAVRPYEKI